MSGDSLHLMAGTLDTTACGGADTVVQVAVVDFAAPLLAPALPQETAEAAEAAEAAQDFEDSGASWQEWEQPALFDPVTLQVLIGQQEEDPAAHADGPPVPVKAVATARKRQRPSRAKPQASKS